MDPNDALLALGSYSHQDVNFGKYFKAVTQAGKEVLKTALVLIYEKNNHSEKGKMPLNLYFTTVEKWSNTKLNKVFTKNEVAKLNLIPSDDAFEGDVTFFNKIVMALLVPDNLGIKDVIRKLKNLRNFVSHEEASIDDYELVKRFDELKSLCARTLELVGILTQNDTSKQISDLVDSLDQLNSKNAAEIVASCITSYRQFNKDQIGKLIQSGRRELKAAYGRYKILNPCCWLNDSYFPLHTVENVFTVLQLSHSAEKVEMHDILGLQSSLTERFNAQVIILSGSMGSGKTSLCRYLVHEWCSYSNSVAGLRDCDFLIFISMRQVISNNLQQFIKEELLKSSTADNKSEDILPLLQNMNIIFVIDGYDEGNHSSRLIVEEIIKKFETSKVVLSSRPEFVHDLQQMVGNHIVVNVMGFDERCIKKYVRKVLLIKEPDETIRENTILSFNRYIFGVGKCLGSHLYKPLTIAILLTLWLDDNSRVTNITSATKLYMEVINMCRVKLVWRLKNKNHHHQISVDQPVEKWYQNVTRTAWQMMIADELMLPNEDQHLLIQAARHEGIDPVESMSAFFSCEVHETFRGIQYSYAFQHTSAAEFLAAEHCAKLLKNKFGSTPEEDGKDEEIHNILLAKKNVSRFKEMLTFTVGILSEWNAISVPIAEYLVECLMKHARVSPNDAYSWYNLIKESGNHEAICQATGEVLNKSATWTIHSRSNNHLTKVHVNLLKSTVSSPSQVTIYIDYSKDASDIPHLEELLKLLAVNKKSRVNLYFEKQFNEIKHRERMDALVTPLLQADMVEELKGHAGEKLTAAMKNTKNINSLFLRISSAESLTHLSDYFKQFYESSFPVLRNIMKRKSSVSFFELFLDFLPSSVPLKNVPKLRYRGDLILKFHSICDEDIDWCAKVTERLNKEYSSIILIATRVTFNGVTSFLNKIENVKVEQLKVQSTYVLQGNDHHEIINFKHPAVGWNNLNKA